VEGYPTVDDLLGRWQSVKDQDPSITIEKLCGCDPTEAAEMTERLQAVASMMAFLGVDAEPGSIGTRPTDGDGSDGSSSTGIMDALVADECQHGLQSRKRIPGYEILGELGRGGMGVVYKARQQSLDRIVALKMILAASHASPTAITRFLHEAKTIALLTHPHIVQVFDYGSHEGKPYFSMEYLERGSLADELRGEPQPPTRAAQMVEALARAAQVAHDRGIVHRDLKPANVLLAGDGTPKITDFGVAKRGDSVMTATGDVLGTPSYMAPEQAGGKIDQVGPASDIYALGAILYELLTGRPPFRGETVLDTLQQVKTAEPIPPSRLLPGLPRDIETIALKCLHKDPLRRYASATELAEDLARFQAGKPIQARPVGWAERTWRWCRRNPAQAGAAAAGAAALLLGTAVSTGFAVVAQTEAGRARASEHRAETARREAQAQLADLAADAGVTAARREDHARALLWFSHAVRLAASDPERERLNRIRVRNWERRVLQPEFPLTLPGFRSKQDRFLTFEFHASGRYLLALSTTGTTPLWDVIRRVEVPLPGGPPKLSAAAFSPDGDLLAVATPEGKVEVRTFPALEPLAGWDTEADRVNVLAFGPDGLRLAVGDQRGARVWDVKHRQFATPLLPHPAPVVALTFDRRGTRLVTVATDRLARTFDLAAQALKPLHAPVEHSLGGFGISHGGPDVVAPRFVLDDRILLTSSGRSDLVCRDAATGAVLTTVKPPPGNGNLTSFAVSPDGTTVAVLWENAVRVFTINPAAADHPGAAIDEDTSNSGGLGNGRIRLVVSAPHTDTWNEHVAFSPGGDVLAVGGHDTDVRFWSPEETDDLAARPLHNPLRHPTYVVRVGFSPDRSRLAVAQWDGAVWIWRLPTAPKEDFRISKPGPTRVALSPEGRQFLLSGVSFRNCTLVETRVFDAATGKPAGPPLKPGGVIVDAAFSPDGHRVATISSAANTPSGRDRIIFEPDGRAGNLQLWDWAAGAHITAPVGLPSEPRGLDYSPDGRTVAVTCADGWVVLVDSSNGAIRHKLDVGIRTRPQNANLWWSNGQARFSPDGTRLMTWEMNPVVHVWDPATGRRIADLRHDDRIETVAFGRDSDLMITCARDLKVRVWDIRLGRLAAPPMQHPRPAMVARFTPDGERVESVGDDGIFCVWDWRRNQLLLARNLGNGSLLDFALTLDRRWLTATGPHGSVLVDSSTGAPVAPHLFGDQAINLRVTIPPDGRRAIVSGFGEEVIGYDLASLLTPAAGSVDELIARAELLSGERILENLELVQLTPYEWAERWARRLQDPGSSPPGTAAPDSDQLPNLIR
jgi:eukaryotic-like serine/threonine-protein kinase